MAALRPEPETPPHPELVSGNASGDQPHEDEVKSPAGEAAESEVTGKAEGKEKEAEEEPKACSDESAQDGSRSPPPPPPHSRQSSTAARLQQLPRPAADEDGDAAPLSDSEEVSSETEADGGLKPSDNSCKENTETELQLKSDDQAKGDVKDDGKHSGSKDEEEYFTDVSVEMDCNDDSKEHEEEEKEEESLGEEEGEPEGGEEEKEELEEGGEDKGGVEEEEELQETGVKRRKSSLECRECGKKFTRRETFNLHRHFHMHQDEQASLTCKECGLTFQHRSSLIKHRSEHRQVEVSPQSTTSPPYRRSLHKVLKVERSLECDYCGDRFSTLIAYKLHACQQRTEKPYRCPLCRREFQYRVSINAHMQSHSFDSPYRCLECNKGFQCALTLHIHQRSHAALKPYECPDCGMVFRHRFFMEDHRRKHTEEKPHQCKICGKSFKYSSLLQQHQYLHTGQKPYRCPDCGKRFAFAQNMRAHCRQHKKNIDSTRSEESYASYSETNGTDVGTSGKENANRDLQQPRNCPLCPQLFYKASDLREHMLIHEAEYEKMTNGNQVDQVYSCPYCSLKFRDESTLQAHALSHQVVQARREALSVARADSADNMSGDGDWVDQGDRRSLRCKDCGKGFHYRSVLELHMRIHNKGYQCHICKKSFRFSSYLQQHLIIHSGKKPYKCPDCGKDFAFLQNMKTHQRLHLQKPFRCTQCRKGYSDEAQLQRHMLSHSGDKPHKCHLCDKSFGLAYLLRDHLNTHTGERPHRCQECHKSFPWLSSLLVHQKIHVRKRQGLSQSSASFGVSQRGRSRGMGGRGRRSSRWGSGWPRVGDAMGRGGLQQASFPGQVLQGAGLPNMVGQHQPVFDADMPFQSWPTDGQARAVHLQPQQQQWQIQIQPPLQPHSQAKRFYEGQPSDIQQPWQQGSYYKPILPKLDSLPKPPHHQQQQQVPSTQTGTAANQNRTEQDSGGTASKTPDSAGFAHSMSKPSNEQEQKKHDQATFRASSPISMNVDAAQSPATKTFTDITQNIKRELPSPSETGDTTDGSMMRDKKQSDKPVKSKDDPPQAQESSGLPGSSKMEPEEKRSKPWNLRTPLERSRTKRETSANEKDTPQSQQQQLAHQQPPPSQISLLQEQQEKQLQQQLHLLQQQNQIPPVWVSTPQPNPLGSVSIQLGPARFAPGSGSAVWRFQTAPVVTQALVNGPLQQGSPVRAAQQQSPVVTGPPILLNQTSPFISLPLPLPPPPPPLALPGPHSIHPVTGQPPPSIFFTPQGLNERSVLPQALPSPHLAQHGETLANQIPFAPDRRFQCMICGGTLPGELELQMHYMQHAQGEI